MRAFLAVPAMALALAACAAPGDDAAPVDPIQAACNQLVALDAQIARWAPVAAIWGYDLDALIAEREEVQKVLLTADVLCVPPEA